MDKAMPLDAMRSGTDLLREYLAERDVACPSCQYNLRNLTSATCPECGERLVLLVRSADPRQAAPLAGLIFLSAGAGLNGLLLIYGVVKIFYNHQRYGFEKFLWVNSIGLVVMTALILLWLKCWRYLRRLESRWLLAACCLLASLADLIGFSIVIN